MRVFEVAQNGRDIPRGAGGGAWAEALFEERVDSRLVAQGALPDRLVCRRLADILGDVGVRGAKGAARIRDNLEVFFLGRHAVDGAPAGVTFAEDIGPAGHRRV